MVRTFRTTVVLALVAALYAVTGPALAKSIKFEDKKRGFRLQLDADFEQVPPKLDNSEAHIVGQWYDSSPKYSNRMAPNFSVRWAATAKGPITPSSGDNAAEPEEEPPERSSMHPRMRAAMENSPLFGDFMAIWEINPRFFGKMPEDLDELLQSGKKFKTKGKKHEGTYVEFMKPNKKSKKAKNELATYVLIGKVTLDRRTETIDVGFLAYCPQKDFKKMGKVFIKAMKSFSELEGATDSGNRQAQKGRIDAAKDPEAFRKNVIENKVIKGWKYINTPNYIVLHDGEVDKKLAKAVATRIEAIRAQIYEHVFPSDEKMTAISVVRVCKDRKQYLGYGAPGGSAGYWSSRDQELVFYFDKGEKKGPMKVLHHEAFHQYIFYSAGQLSPHSWFNEGNGDYFYGHDYTKSGKFKKNVSRARIGTAGSVKAEWKKTRAAQGKPKPGETTKAEGRYVPLREWLGWSQGKYYGRNKAKLSGLANYAMGWDFIYFLRTTKKYDGNGMLDRYFNKLKERTTAARKWAEEQKKKAEEAGGDPDMAGMMPPPELGNMRIWQNEALDAFLEGVDVYELESAWFAYKP